MNSIRSKYIRGEQVKFISHLDLMKVFERAIRRANIPIAYSQGFNPHPQMVFGLPLSVGVTSEAEYLDIEFAEDVKPQEFIQKLNSQLPKGLMLVEAKYLNTKANIMKSISYASYDVVLSSSADLDINELDSVISELIAKSEIMVKKEGKKGIRDIDIRPMVLKVKIAKKESHEISLCEKSNIFCLSMLVSAGSVANLKPELLVAAINELGNINLKIEKIHRTGLFVSEHKIPADPLDDRALLEA